MSASVVKEAMDSLVSINRSELLKELNELPPIDCYSGQQYCFDTSLNRDARDYGDEWTVVLLLFDLLVVVYIREA